MLLLKIICDVFLHREFKLLYYNFIGFCAIVNIHKEVKGFEGAYLPGNATVQMLAN